MNERSYRPGGWYAVVGEHALVALPPSEKARVAALWEVVDSGAGFDVTLDALISSGLRDLPGFVLVGADEEQTRIVVRGSARVELETAGETVTVDGQAAATWAERAVTGVERLSVVLEDAADGPTYALGVGLVRVSRLDQGEPRAVEPEPEPAPEPEPVRSPEPPSWTPPPPASPSGPPPPPPVLPTTEAMQLPPTPLPGAEPESDPDHDGLTRTGSWRPPPEVPPGIPGQERVPDVTIPVARLLISNGEVVDVDRAVVIGRAPEARRFSETEQPKLVTVASPHLEISSTHVEVRPGSGADHGSAVVTDLGSTNGTVLIQPGIGPEDLAAGVAVQLSPGAVIDLGDGVTIQVTKV